MPDLFDLPPAQPKPVVKVAPQPEPKIAPICQPEPEPANKPCSLPEPAAELCHLVASFSCYCGCQDEVLEPAPLEIPCWGCKRTMHRWYPKYGPPPVSARVWLDV